MSKKEVYGFISLNYSEGWLLPLEEAHKVQAILAKHAIKVEGAWRKGSAGNVGYMRDTEVPDVKVKSMPEYDARGLTNKQIQEWREAIQDAEGEVVIQPKEFIAIKGEDGQS